jgi:plastocyanin
MQAYRLALLTVVVLVGACGGGKNEAPSGPPPGAKLVDSAKSGTITGRIVFEGTPPPNPPIRMDSDPVCLRANAGAATAETFLVDDGGLENVFVYLKDGLDGYYFDTPATPVVLDQKGCRYVPHVLGLQVGQPLEITNSDNTLHNVHAVASVNQEFNVGQALAGMKNTKRFTAPEVMVPLKCDVHGWMSAFLGVVAHPYFSVSANGGKFELKNVPPGTYTIEAWHEKLGKQTQRVTLGEKESKDLTFSFKAQS